MPKLIKSETSRKRGLLQATFPELRENKAGRAPTYDLIRLDGGKITWSEFEKLKKRTQERIHIEAFTATLNFKEAFQEGKGELARERRTKAERGPLFSELVEAYEPRLNDMALSTWRSRTINLKHWSGVFKNRYARDIRDYDITKERDALRPGRKPSTVNQYVAALHVCFQHAIDNKILRDDQGLTWVNTCSSIKRLKIGEQRYRVLSEEE